MSSPHLEKVWAKMTDQEIEELYQEWQERPDVPAEFDHLRAERHLREQRQYNREVRDFTRQMRNLTYAIAAMTLVLLVLTVANICGS